VGRLAGVDGHQVRFADDLTESVAWGDARYADIDQLLAAQLGGRAPHWPDPPPFRADPPVELNLRGRDAAARYSATWKPESDAVTWISERVLFDNPLNTLRSTVTMALGVNVVGQAKSATVPYSEVREKARQLGPLWA
jgi:hypothetical protein